MSDTIGPFDSADWAQGEWYDHMPARSPSGVVGDPVSAATAGGLAFSNSGLTVSIGDGKAEVGGSGFKRAGGGAGVTVPANTSSTQSRRDRVVLRRDTAADTVAPTLIQGTPAASPTAPAITRSSTVFDLPLFSFLVPPSSGTSLSGVVDERLFVNDDGYGLPQVFSMANRPTAGLRAGFRVSDASTGRLYSYDGTYWRDPFTGAFVPTGTPAGAYITAVCGSTQLTTPDGDKVTIALGRTYAAASFYAMVCPGDNVGSFGIVIPEPSEHTTTTVKVRVRTASGALLANGTTVRVNWHVIGYNT